MASGVASNFFRVAAATPCHPGGFATALNETERHKSYILVIQDYFTKWVEAFHLANEKAETVAEVLASEWVCRYGAPQVLHSDQGRNFESEVFQKMCSLFGIEKTCTRWNDSIPP